MLDAAARERLAALRAADRAAATAAQEPSSEGVSERFITAFDSAWRGLNLRSADGKVGRPGHCLARSGKARHCGCRAGIGTMGESIVPTTRINRDFWILMSLRQIGRGAGAEAAQRGLEEVREYQTPEHIRKRFIEADDKFYYRNNENKLAFQDSSCDSGAQRSGRGPVDGADCRGEGVADHQCSWVRRIQA